MESKNEAQECVKKLGIHELLQSHNVWENPPTPLLDEAASFDDEDDDDEGEIAGDGVLSELLKEANSSQDDEAVVTGISKLLSAGVIGQAEHESLTEIHKKAFTCVPSDSVPLFEEMNKIT